MKLTRAAFAVIIKFSEQIGIFTNVWNAVEEAGFSIDQGDLTEQQRCEEIIMKLRDHEYADLFEIICTQWEQAAQIRRWTQEMKKDLTESLKSEITDELIREINDKMVKLAKEEKKTKSKEEEKKDDTVQIITTEEETKDAEQVSDKDKEEDAEEDDDDEVLFTGPLNNEQTAEVETRAFQQMQAKMQEAIEDSILKARFLLKMIIPEAYKKEQAEELQKEISRRQS